MKYYGEEQFNEQNSQGYNNGYYQNPQQGYDNDRYQNPQQGYGNGYYQNPQQQQYYNNTGYQDPMMDGKFHRPNFDNQPYNRNDFFKQEISKDPNRKTWSECTTSEKIKSVLFVLWFFGSMAMMILIKETGELGLLFILFGQVFAGVGLLALSKIKNKLENALIFIFPIIGIGMIIAGLIMMFGTQEMMNIFTAMIPFMFLGVFLIVGILLLVVTPIGNKKKKARCSVPVKAVVVDLIRSTRHSNGRRSRTYTPVYEYYYNGNTYRERDAVGTNVGLPSVGQEMEAYVNPDDPNEIYVEWKGKNTASTIIGLVFIIIPIAVAALILSQYFA